MVLHVRRILKLIQCSLEPTKLLEDGCDVMDSQVLSDDAGS